MARLRIVSPTSQVKVATSEHQYFSSDSVLLRATWGSASCGAPQQDWAIHHCGRVAASPDKPVGGDMFLMASFNFQVESHAGGRSVAAQPTAPAPAGIG